MEPTGKAKYRQQMAVAGETIDESESEMTRNDRNTGRREEGGRPPGEGDKGSDRPSNGERGHHLSGPGPQESDENPIKPPK